MTGERKMKSTVLPMPAPTSAPNPLFATPAPMSPPMSAWEDDDGSPAHQVMMFHAEAPTSAPKITYWSTIAGSTMPLPTVAATFRWKMKSATKLNTAAITTAWCGFSTPVETTVAIELAASCSPFRKSNARASTTRNASTPKPIWRLLMGGRRCPAQVFSSEMPSARFATSRQRSVTASSSS